jgi:hypothetical protein
VEPAVAAAAPTEILVKKEILGGLCSFTLYGKKSKKPIFDKENKCIDQSMSMCLFKHIYVRGRAYVCGRWRIFFLKN